MKNNIIKLLAYIFITCCTFLYNYYFNSTATEIICGFTASYTILYSFILVGEYVTSLDLVIEDKIDTRNEHKYYLNKQRDAVYQDLEQQTVNKYGAIEINKEKALYCINQGLFNNTSLAKEDDENKLDREYIDSLL